MKKIKDDRLILKNLKNIRGAYIIQTLGIFCILGYDWITRGSEAMFESPLWFVFIVSTTALTFFSMDISVAHESRRWGIIYCPSYTLHLYLLFAY